MSLAIRWIAPIVLGCGLLAVAAENPAAGAWRLNPAKSHITGPLPTFVQNGMLQVQPEIYTGGKAPARRARRNSANAAAPVYKFDFASDGRTVTLTRPTADPELKLVFERQ